MSGPTFAGRAIEFELDIVFVSHPLSPFGVYILQVERGVLNGTLVLVVLLLVMGRGF